MSNISEAEQLTNRIEAARREASITLLTLSETSGIPYSTLRRKLANPGLFNIRELSEIAVALNTDLTIGFAA